MKTESLNTACHRTCDSVVVPSAALAQQTNNASNLTNQAAPSASAVTTGGTNINYQTNNTYQNEVGLGPVCSAGHLLSMWKRKE